MVASGDVTSFVWAPDGTRLAFRGDKDVDGVYGLWTVPPTGGSPANVSGTLVTNGDVLSGFTWAPDSSRIAFRADAIVDTQTELFTVAPTSAAPTVVSGAMVTNGDVAAFRWAPDGAEIAFSADRETDADTELYVAPAAGGADPIQISGPMAIGADVTAFEYSPDGRRVAFELDANVDGVNELFTVLLSSRQRSTVSGAMPATADVVSFRWAPDSQRVAFTRSNAGLTDLRLGPPDGSDTPKAVSGSLIGSVSSFVWPLPMVCGDGVFNSGRRGSSSATTAMTWTATAAPRAAPSNHRTTASGARACVGRYR